MGYSPWGHKQSDTTEWLHFTMFKWLLKELSSSSHIHTHTQTHAGCWQLAGDVLTLLIGAKTDKLLVQTHHCHPAAAPYSIFYLPLPLEWSLLLRVSSILISLARLICPSAYGYDSLQIHSYMVCWLTSSHQKAAVTIQIVHKSRRFVRKRDSLQPSNIRWGHIFIWLSLEAPLSLIHMVLELYIRVDSKIT